MGAAWHVWIILKNDNSFRLLELHLQYNKEA
jgi:hypothetical protein